MTQHKNETPTPSPAPFDTSVPPEIEAIIAEAKDAIDTYLDYQLLSQS